MKKLLVSFFLLGLVFFLLFTSAFAQRKRIPQKPSVNTKPVPSTSTANCETQTAQKFVTNVAIVCMVKGGFGESVIINHIQTNETQFDVSMNALFDLKKAGVSQRIIEAMQLSATNKNQTQSAPTFPVKNPEQKNASQVFETAPTLSEEQLKNLSQPFALIVNENRKTVLPANAPNLVQSKAKGDDIATILVDNTLRDIAENAIVDVAVKGIL